MKNKKIEWERERERDKERNKRFARISFYDLGKSSYRPHTTTATRRRRRAAFSSYFASSQRVWLGCGRRRRRRSFLFFFFPWTSEKIEREKFLFGAENALVLHKHVITIIKKKTKSKSLSLSLFSRNFFGSWGRGRGEMLLKGITSCYCLVISSSSPIFGGGERRKKKEKGQIFNTRVLAKECASRNIHPDLWYR